jgi:hypothetical protein
MSCKQIYKTVTISKSKLLYLLVNSVHPKGLGWLQHDGKIYTRSEADKSLKLYAEYEYVFLMKRQYVDYEKGRCIKIDFATYPKINCTEFDICHGVGTFEHIIENHNKGETTFDIPPITTEAKLCKEIDELWDNW